MGSLKSCQANLKIFYKMKNSIGRDVPEHIKGVGKISAYGGAWTKLEKGWMNELTVPPPNKAKLPHQKIPGN